MPLQLKDIVKLNQIIERIQAGRFDANDVDNLLMKLRAYAADKTVFLEVANFVAHSDARDRGHAQRSMTAFVDYIQYFQEYISTKRELNISRPFPAYIYRLFLSQTHLSDESQLKKEYKMSHATLIKKIEANFSVDKKTNTCSLKSNKGGAELLAALRYITAFLHSKPAFHMRDLHKELKEVLHKQKIAFDEKVWDTQTNRISLAILCLISNTEFSLSNGSRGNCRLDTENQFKILSGQRRLPSGILTTEPDSLGHLIILGEATVISENKAPARMRFPLIETDLNPYEHCDPKLFVREQAPEEFGDCMLEFISFTRDMSLSNNFKLVRTDSLI